MKAEEKTFRKVWIDNFGHSPTTDKELETICKSHHYIFEAMQQYANEVRRDEMEQAFKAGMVFQQFDTTKDFDEWWDWLKEQEE